MAYLDIHPEYRDLLARHGLTTAANFLALPGVICCGHPDRNVARVTLGNSTDAVSAFLKREHRTHWRDRFLNAYAGFGMASKSRREFKLLRDLEGAGIGAPQAIAVGEDDHGRAFLLVRELDNCQELRQLLSKLPTSSTREFASQIGMALARLHIAGFEHADLYSKHILANETPSAAGFTFSFVDWQRGRRRDHIDVGARWRDLAALDATLADDLAAPHLRLRALRSYLRASNDATLPNLASAAQEIRRRALRLLEHRRIREMRQPPLDLGKQNLIWLEGEALQVTREFRDELGGDIPDWLKKRTRLVTNKNVRPLLQVVQLKESRMAHLVTSLASHPWRWLWASFRRRSIVGPELESMKVLFRLQRYGVVMPRLLAAGQKQLKPWQTQSFLLTEPVAGAVPLAQFLGVSDPMLRRQILRQTASVLRQMHNATCYVEDENLDAISELLTVCCPADSGLTVALSTVHGIEKSHYPNPMKAQRDLAALVKPLAGACTQTDLLRGLLTYTSQQRLTAAGKQFARRILQRVRSTHNRRRVAA